MQFYALHELVGRLYRMIYRTAYFACTGRSEHRVVHACLVWFSQYLFHEMFREVIEDGVQSKVM